MKNCKAVTKQSCFWPRFMQFLLDNISILCIMLSTHFIIEVTESWSNENIEDAEIGIDGYDLFRDDRPAGHKGGEWCYTLIVPSIQ